MKKLSIITGVLTCLMVLLAALGAVCGAIDQIATDEQFYGGMSRAAVMEYLGVTADAQASQKVTQYIGMTDEEQTAFASEMAAFMAGSTQMLPDMLSEDEQQHMRDVRRLTRAAAQASRTCMTLAAVLAVAAAWTGALLKRRALCKAVGSLAGITVLALCGAGVMAALRTGGFEAMFVGMHELLFTNDLWLMDPATDILIRMMPQPLFEQALMDAAQRALKMFMVVWIMMIAVHGVVAGMIRRHVAKGE